LDVIFVGYNVFIARHRHSCHSDVSPTKKFCSEEKLTKWTFTSGK
jgi:hypothetical protein